MSTHLLFKTVREEDGYNNLDPRIKGLLLALALWQFLKWGIPLTITCIVRTLQENKDVGGQDNSAHILRPGQLWARAVDLRNHDLTEQQQAERREFVLSHWNFGQMPAMFHMIDHDSGHGQHTHLNLNYQYMI